MNNQVGPIIASMVLIIGMAIFIVVLFHAGQGQAVKARQNYRDSLTLYNQGDYPGAEQAIRSWMQNGAGNYVPAEYQFGRCLVQEGRTNEALQQFQQADKDAQGYYGGGRGNEWYPPLPDIESKAQGAINWIQQNPNWLPGQGQAPISPRSLPGSLSGP